MQSEQKESIHQIYQSFSQALPASVQALLENVWALTTSVTDGQSASESFARLSPDGVFLKTYRGCCQLMLGGSLETFSGSWPKSGMMLAGQCMEPPMLAHRISGKDCALWATPNTMDSLPSRSFEAMKRQATNGGRKNRSHPGNLREQIDPLMQLAYDEAKAEANNWPTPCGSEARQGVQIRREGKKGTQQSLSTVVAITEGTVQDWPTPKSSIRGDCPSERARRSPDLHAAVHENWTTPNARDGHGKIGFQNQPCLCNQVANWSTPQMGDYRSPNLNPGNQSNSGILPQSEHTLPAQAGGLLNADWVDTLMGYPVGWTETKLCATFDMFRKRRPAEVFSQSWPSRRGELQHDWEPPRVVTGQKGRVARIKMLGNAVVPQWAYIPLYMIAAIESSAPL